MATPYGAEHQKTRARLLPHAYGKPCPRCKKPMLKGQALDLGHSVDVIDDPTAVGDRIEHESCNSEAGLLAGQRHSRFKPSRDW